MKINDSWRYNEGIEDIKKELKINESKVEDEDDEGEGIEEDKKKNQNPDCKPFLIQFMDDEDEENVEDEEDDEDEIVEDD